MTFAMVVPRRPPSLRAGGKHLFQEALRNQATAVMDGRTVLTGDLYSRILWFHRKPAAQDVDNILKNIHDSLKGVVYRDDSAIVQCLAQRIDLLQDYDIDDSDIARELFRELNALLTGNESNILYVEVGSVPSQNVIFGRIDGGSP